MVLRTGGTMIVGEHRGDLSRAWLLAQYPVGDHVGALTGGLGGFGLSRDWTDASSGRRAAPSLCCRCLGSGRTTTPLPGGSGALTSNGCEAISECVFLQL